MNEVHKVDRDLLLALIRDGRMSLTDLAEQVGLSVSAVHQRVRRLEKQGLISGYVAHVRPGRAPADRIRVHHPDRSRGT
jgi:Lrp/AsnC family leucine-responsive transcriptional regulator